MVAQADHPLGIPPVQDDPACDLQAKGFFNIFAALDEFWFLLVRLAS